MARRRRQHVNPLTFEHLERRNEPLEIPESGFLEVALGCGDGLFIVERARANPDGFYLGIDIRKVFLEPGLERIQELGLHNIRLEIANLIVDGDSLFPKDRIDRLFINFPDPFFKRRHHRRRWLTNELLHVLVDMLKDGGELIYQSDVWDCTVEALGLFELSPALENRLGAFSFSRDPLVTQQTTREVSCLERGLKIWRLSYQKRGRPSANGAG